MVEAVLVAIPMMANLFAVLLLFFVVAAVLGVVLFGGVLSWRCMDAAGACGSHVLSYMLPFSCLVR
jgi:hypothetical protein